MPRLLKRHEAVQEQRWLPKPAELPAPPPPPGVDPQVVAAQIIAKANEEASAIIATAHQETEQLRQGAHEEGLAAGREEGQALATQQIQGKMIELEALEAAVNEERDAFFTQAETEVVRLAITIAEKVLAQQLSAQPEIIVDLARTHLKRLRERKVVRLRVNPEDIPYLSEARQQLIRESDGVEEIQLHDDRRVGRGGFILETDSAALDARVTSQLEVIKKALLKPKGKSQDVLSDTL
ncbi:MAG TPA: FliH/SctL family protein [Armatimonadota bacterium]|jgi:flagellar assembly protein FliH